VYTWSTGRADGRAVSVGRQQESNIDQATGEVVAYTFLPLRLRQGNPENGKGGAAMAKWTPVMMN
jgi:hypothetical protein